jgi:glycosyltransferase involved in cell wall biosynthesis
MLTLLDARLGRNLSGIGQYVVNLAEQFGEISDGEVRAIVNRGQRDRFRGYGLPTWTPARSLARRAPALRLPPADVVHGPNFHPPEHPTAAGVATIHDLGYITLPDCHPPGMPERLDAIVRASLDRTAVFLCDSHATMADFIEIYGVAEDRCRVVHLGVGARFLAAGGATSAPPAGVPSPYLLSVGAMVQRKDLPTLLRTFELVSDEHPDLALALAGHKTKRWASGWPQVEAWLAEHPALRSRVHVLEYVRDEDLPALYAHAAAVVTTTLLEGFGLTVLEGLASGAPVVASRVSAIPEVAGEAVYYGEVRRPETYAAAIDAALRSHDADAAERGRAIARRYTWRATAERTLAAYRDAAAA